MMNNKLEKIAVLGPKGTFSDNAYMKYEKMTGKNFEVIYYNTIDEVFFAVDEGSCELGIAPIENSLDGYVQRTLDLLLEKDVYAFAETTVDVQFSLIGNVKSLSEIDTLYVQFKANGQCRDFINRLGNIQIVTTSSNMESYYKIGETKNAAAIIPYHIAEKERDNYDKLIVDNVTDSSYNRTRFVILKKGSVDKSVKFETAKVRMPAFIMPKTDRPGLLYDILKVFNESKINLISIMSRPTKQQLGTYNFYVEIECKSERLNVALETVDNIYMDNELKILGIYGV